MRGSALALSTLGLVLTQAGCIAFPFITPPLQLSVGPAVRYGAPKKPSRNPVFAHVDVGLRPLQLMRDWRQRRAEVGAGYAVDAGSGPLLHCIYMDGTFFPYVDSTARLGIHAQPRVHIADDTGRASFGMGTRVDIEGRWFVSKSFSSSGSRAAAIGYAHGEGAFGLYVEGGYAKLEDRPTFSVGLGLTARIPLTAGVALVFMGR
jgi:hypothetical protein